VRLLTLPGRTSMTNVSAVPRTFSRPQVAAPISSLFMVMLVSAVVRKLSFCSFFFSILVILATELSDGRVLYPRFFLSCDFLPFLLPCLFALELPFPSLSPSYNFLNAAIDPFKRVSLPT